MFLQDRHGLFELLPANFAPGKPSFQQFFSRQVLLPVSIGAACQGPYQIDNTKNDNGPEQYHEKQAETETHAGFCASPVHMKPPLLFYIAKRCLEIVQIRRMSPVKQYLKSSVHP
jgi:hypothetical protein